MGEQTAIAWTTHTFNPWTGCARVSPGCQHCYAEAWAKRSGLVEWGVNAERRRTTPANWRKPIAWNHAARVLDAPDARTFVFCASLADVFEDRPELAPWREDLFDLIEQTPHLTWQLLTKRPENVRAMTRYRWLHGLPDNVWVGTTVEDQQRADERIPQLLEVPAVVRFLSCEPLLGPVDLSRAGWLVPEALVCGAPRAPRTDAAITAINSVLRAAGGRLGGRYIDWVIVGGESGPGHRPLDLDHARGVVEQCQRAGVPVFFKQVGGAKPTSGGDLLDGIQIKQMPVAR